MGITERIIRDLPAAIAEAEEAPKSAGLPMIAVFASHGSHCQVFRLPQGSLAVYEWHVHFPSGAPARGQTVELSAAVNAAVAAAKEASDAERARQQSEAMDQGEVLPCET